MPSTEHADPVPQPLEGPLPMEGFVLFGFVRLFFLTFCLIEFCAFVNFEVEFFGKD